MAATSLAASVLGVAALLVLFTTANAVTTEKQAFKRTLRSDHDREILLWHEVENELFDAEPGLTVTLAHAKALENSEEPPLTLVDSAEREYEAKSNLTTWRDCVEAGYWWVDIYNGSCWAQIVTDEILSHPAYCYLDGGQKKRFCEAAGCEWHPEDKWRCRKPTPEHIEIPFIYFKMRFKDSHGVNCTTLAFSVGTSVITQQECGAGYVWIPMPTWQCWKLVTVCPKQPEPEDTGVEAVPEEVESQGEDEEQEASGQEETAGAGAALPEPVVCGHKGIRRKDCLAQGCTWVKANHWKCWDMGPPV